MSRGRKRKSDKGSFSEAAMQRAVQQVLVGVDGKKLSLRKAAAENGLKFQTLQRYVKKKQLNPEEKFRMAPNYKSRLIFTEDEEKSLVDYMIECSKMCYGKSTKDFRELAYEMAIINKKNMPASWESNLKAGIDWMQGFIKRHPEISIRQPESCSISRATSFNKKNVNMFFDNIENAYSRSENFSDGSRIYNLDETGTTTVQRPKKVFAAKGAKQVSQCTSGERGDLVTTCCFVSASGNTLPPAMVFPRKNFKAHMTNGAPPGTLGLATNSGWMTGEVFPTVMKHFISYSGSTKINPTILILDNHKSHLTIETLNMAKENGVIIVTLPPHCSHKLQPLDVSVFQSFKAHYNAAVDSWLLHNPGIPMTIYQIASCVGTAHEHAMTPSNIKAGFRKSGIYPFNRNVFNDDEFLTSYVTDREFVNDHDDLCENLIKEIDPTTSVMPANIELDAGVEYSSLSVLSNDINDGFISPQAFKGFPKAGERKGALKNKRKSYSSIPTDTPEKNKLEVIFKNRELLKRKIPFVKKKREMHKTVKELKKLKKSQHYYSDSESDISVEEVNELPEVDYSLDTLAVNDFVLVEFSTKKTKIHYVARIDKLEAGEAQVKFMRKQNNETFVFPQNDDVATVEKTDIILKLPQPSISGGTFRALNSFSFAVKLSQYNVR